MYYFLVLGAWTVTWTLIVYLQVSLFVYLLVGNIYPSVLFLSPWCMNYYMLKLTLQFSEHGEGLQVLHYEVGQKYDAHFDYFLDEFNTKNGGQRVATLLMYLYECTLFYPYFSYSHFIIWIYMWPILMLQFFPFLHFLTIDAGRMLKRGVRLYFLQQREMSVLCHGGMSYPNVVNRDLQWNRKWVMHYYFGACGLMLL